VRGAHLFSRYCGALVRAHGIDLLERAHLALVWVSEERAVPCCSSCEPRRGPYHPPTEDRFLLTGQPPFIIIYRRRLCHFVAVLGISLLPENYRGTLVISCCPGMMFTGQIIK
jgi:hypothetical protein